MAEANVADLNEELIELGTKYRFAPRELESQDFAADALEVTLRNIASVLVVLQDAVEGVQDYHPHRGHGQWLILEALVNTAMSHADHLDSVGERLGEVYRERLKNQEHEQKRDEEVNDPEMQAITDEFLRKYRELEERRKEEEGHD